MNPLFYPNILTQTIDNIAIVLIIIGGVLLLTSAIILLIAFLRKKKGPSLKEDDWLIALGGKDNIKEVTAIGSRLSINLIDKEIIDKDKLKQLGVTSVLVMSNKVTLVIEGKAEEIASSIQKSL